MVARLFVAVVLVAAGVFGGVYLYNHQAAVCPGCLRTMHPVTQFSVHLGSGEVIDACCPRCGMAVQTGLSDVVGATVADFNSKTALAAEEAFYVEGSRIHMCCSGEVVRKDIEGGMYQLVMDRCMPSIVAFATLEDARRFVEMRGGEVRSYADLLAGVPEQVTVPAVQ